MELIADKIFCCPECSWLDLDRMVSADMEWAKEQQEPEEQLQLFEEE